MRAASRWMVVGTCLATACAGSAKDPGPHDIDGWIGQCEAQCDQQASCNPNQLLWDHGDLDNCIYDCSYYLDRDDNVQLVEETPAACLEALYAQLKCVYHLGCDDLDTWRDCADDAPCTGETAASAEACAGIDLADFLQDCGAYAQGCAEV